MDQAQDERQELQDVRDRFFEFLWNYSEYINAEAQPEANTPGSSIDDASATFPYRCVAFVDIAPLCVFAGAILTSVA